MSATEKAIKRLAKGRVLRGVAQRIPEYPTAPRLPVNLQPLFTEREEIIARVGYRGELEKRAALRRHELTLISSTIRWHNSQIEEMEARSFLAQTDLAEIAHEINVLGNCSTSGVDAAIQAALDINRQVAANGRRAELEATLPEFAMVVPEFDEEEEAA